MSSSNKANDFIKSEVLRMERNSFIFRIIATAVGYAGITLWLNAVRTTASLWFVWVLIVIQFALYFSIFIASYRRAVVYGLNKGLGIVIFTALAILGRVNDWELAIIPLMIAIMIVVSARAANVSDKGKSLLPDNLGN